MITSFIYSMTQRYTGLVKLDYRRLGNTTLKYYTQKWHCLVNSPLGCIFLEKKQQKHS